jgi:arylsulfatase A-like enzyme
VLALGCPGHRPLPAGGVAMLPLAAAGPGIVAGVERQGPLSLLDLAPTMAALLGVDPHPDWRGQSVTELLPAPLPAREPVH